MRRAVLPLLLLMLLAAPLAGVTARGGVADWVTPSKLLVVDPHLWRRMAEVLVQRLYDNSTGLFRETWGTPEGQRWHWNTEQGEAAQLLVFLGYSDLLSSLISKYKELLSYQDGGDIYLFTRYVTDPYDRVLSTNLSDASIGNLIVNVGGDLAGNRTDKYGRCIVLSMDIYKDYNNVLEHGFSWPNLWYLANIKSTEVWYFNGSVNGSDYRGIWDTGDGSLGDGRIIDARIYQDGSSYVLERVMSDGVLRYVQDYVVIPGKPYVLVRFNVTNISGMNLTNVRVTLAFDNLDWWQYQYAYLPGVGLVNASTSGSVLSSGDEKEYHLARSWENVWEERNGWRLALFFTKRPIGMNRAFAVLVPADKGVHVWGYGNRQKPDYDWYFRWMKFEVQMGNLTANSTNSSSSVEFKIVPMSSFAPGLYKVYEDMLYNVDSFDGRDFSFAVNTGTGVFKGFAMASIVMSSLRVGDYEFVENVFATVKKVFDSWSWFVSNRALSNYILSALYIYDYTGNRTYLSEAISASNTLLRSQVRDPGDVRNGGFLDIPPPFGAATYLDVNAEVAHALLALYDRTKNETYKEAVDYLMNNWFHYDSVYDRYYYYRYRSLDEAPGEYWYKGYLDEKEPYAQGYFLQAMSYYYWTDPKLIVSLNRIWSLLSDELWELTWDGADETNVETQSSVATGMLYLLENYERHMAFGFEYVRGASLAQFTYEEVGVVNDTAVESRLTLELDTKPFAEFTVCLHIVGSLDYVSMDGVELRNVSSLDELNNTGVVGYYYNESNGLLYIRGFVDRITSTIVVGYVGSLSGSEIKSNLEGSWKVSSWPWKWSPGRNATLPLPDWLQEHKGTVAAVVILGVMLLANEATAGFFAVVGAGLLATFGYWGWLSVPDAVLGLAFILGGLGFVYRRRV